MQNAVTNADLVMMAQGGLSDEVIISTVHSRDGWLDLSPQGVIALKNSGVSDHVIVGVHLYAESEPSAQTVIVPVEEVYAPPPNVVVVPSVSLGVGPRYRPRPPIYRRPHRW